RSLFAGLSVTRLQHRWIRSVLIAVQLRVEGRLHGVAVVILGRDGELHLLARLIHVFVGAHADAKASVGSNDGVEAGDLAAALVGHAGLDGVARIVFMGVKRGGNGDRQLAVGVEFSGLFGKLIAAIIVVAAAAFAVALVVSCIAFVAFVLEIGRPV